MFWTETHGSSPAALLLQSVLTTMEKLSVNWASNVYCLHSPAPSKLFSCLHAWEHVQKGFDLVSGNYLPADVVLSYRPLEAQKQQVMKHQWGRQNDNARKRSKKAIRTQLSFSCQLQKIRPGRPHILWYLSLSDKVLQTACEVQTSDIHMLWEGRKHSLLLERKCRHRSLQSSALQWLEEIRPSKSELQLAAV